MSVIPAAAFVLICAALVALMLLDRRTAAPRWRCTSCGQVGTSPEFARMGCGDPGRAAACPLEPV